LLFLKADLKMKKFIKFFAIGLTAMLFCAFLLVSKNAEAKVDPETAGRKLLKQCAIIVGGQVTQYGNTCDQGGTGCSSNPCGE
jgi:hypothetical protein